MNCRRPGAGAYTAGCRCAGCVGRRQCARKYKRQNPDRCREINRLASARYLQRNRLAYQMYFQLLELSGLRRRKKRGTDAKQ